MWYFCDFCIILLTWYDANPASLITLQWRYTDRDRVSNHQPHVCLLNRLFRKYQSSASRWPANSPHKGPVTRKMFEFYHHDKSVGVWISDYRPRFLCHVNTRAIHYSGSGPKLNIDSKPKLCVCSSTPCRKTFFKPRAKSARWMDFFRFGKSLGSSTLLRLTMKHIRALKGIEMVEILRYYS